VLCGTILQLFNAGVSLIGTIYFWKISKNWVWIEIFACSLGAFAMIGAFIMPESPKFLITRKRFDEAREAISTIARVNGRPAFTDRFDREVVDSRSILAGLNQSTFNDLDSRGTLIDKAEGHKAQVEALLKTPKLQIREEAQLNGTLKDLVKIRRHFINLLIFIYIWIASSFNIYLLTYALKYIPGNIFKNSLMSGITDIPMAMLGGYIYHRLGVRVALCGAFFIALSGGILILLFSESH
jgi:Sugar (and other) transporter